MFMIILYRKGNRNSKLMTEIAMTLSDEPDMAVSSVPNVNYTILGTYERR